jgi:hypothetical protein
VVSVVLSLIAVSYWPPITLAPIIVLWMSWPDRPVRGSGSVKRPKAMLPSRVPESHFPKDISLKTFP